MLAVTVGAAIIAPNVRVDAEKKEISLFDKSANYSIEDKEFEIGDGDEKVTVKNNEITFGSGETKIDIKLSDEDIAKIEGFIEKDALAILAVLPFTLAAATVAVVFFALVFGHCASVFKNIANDKTPFTKDNIDRMEKVAKYLIISYALTLVANLVMAIVSKSTANMNFGAIIWILGTYVFIYILKAGYQLEDVKEGKDE
jgi:hypothetical protein